MRDWFRTRGWSPFAFQEVAWRAYLAGEHGLIHAATGTGKTLAAWLGPIIEYHRLGAAAGCPPIRVLWVTPLRALATDLVANLTEPMVALAPEWTLASRTGDTDSATRARQRRRLPTALVTTPESLSVLLSDPEHPRRLASLRLVVVDEWHELLGTKRGVQLELALARLRHLVPGLRVWGLSATLGNLEQARDALLGSGQTGRLIQGDQPKAVSITAALPDRLERFPWAGHLGARLLPQVIAAIDTARSTLLFCNTRSQAELWHRALLQARPDWLTEIALHHGSLDRDLRARVEQGLRTGSLRCVVCTSSLDLGVDFSPVDRVIQVGSPKGVARLLQRAGRANHQPGGMSAILCVPTHAFELVEIAAVRAQLARGALEARTPLQGCLDVLAQHLVTLAVGGGFRADAVRAEVQTTWAYRQLSDVQWAWVLGFICQGGPALTAYPDYHKVVVDADGLYRVTDRTIARRHRLGIGTITSDQVLEVRTQQGGRLGTIEESFIARLKPGDRFLFAGRTLSLVRVRELTAFVSVARQSAGEVPRWIGGRLAISESLAEGLLTQLRAVRDGHLEGAELTAVAPILELQARWSRLPDGQALVVEVLRSREGHHLFLYPFAGRQVHEGLGALLAYRLSRDQPVTCSVAVNDYGIELLSTTALGMDASAVGGLLSPEGLAEDLLGALNAAELAKRQFRDIARIAGLVFSGYPGQGKSARQLQASSGLLFEVLSEFDPDNQLLAQARQEVLEQSLELRRLRATLVELAEQPIVLETPPRLTPLAFPLWVERVRARVSSEAVDARIQRMLDQLERAADRPAGRRSSPSAKSLD